MRNMPQHTSLSGKSITARSMRNRPSTDKNMRNCLHKCSTTCASWNEATWTFQQPGPRKAQFFLLLARSLNSCFAPRHPRDAGEPPRGAEGEGPVLCKAPWKSWGRSHCEPKARLRTQLSDEAELAEKILYHEAVLLWARCFIPAQGNTRSTNYTHPGHAHESPFFSVHQ